MKRGKKREERREKRKERREKREEMRSTHHTYAVLVSCAQYLSHMRSTRLTCAVLVSHAQYSCHMRTSSPHQSHHVRSSCGRRCWDPNHGHHERGRRSGCFRRIRSGARRAGILFYCSAFYVHPFWPTPGSQNYPFATCCERAPRSSRNTLPKGSCQKTKVCAIPNLGWRSGRGGRMPGADLWSREGGLLKDLRHFCGTERTERGGPLFKEINTKWAGGTNDRLSTCRGA